jgi:hypothetical protein
VTLDDLDPPSNPTPSPQFNSDVHTDPSVADLKSKKHFSSSPSIDLSSLPHRLQNHFDQHGLSNVIRPGIIRVGSVWERYHQDTSFSPTRPFSLFHQRDQQSEKQHAYDLLDALTRSGGLSIEGAMVHVVLTSAHHFDQSLLETVIQKNENPLVRLEESLLVMGSVIQERAIDELLESK